MQATRGLRPMTELDHRHDAQRNRDRGYPIEDPSGSIGFAQMFWLMTRGELPSEGQGRLPDATLSWHHTPRVIDVFGNGLDPDHRSDRADVTLA